MSAVPRVAALHPLTPSQTGMWLQSAAGDGQDRFVEQAAFCLEGGVNREALGRALQCVVDRHGALRSSILARGLRPFRAVLQEMRVSLREVAAGDDEDAALTALMDAERRRGFPLNRPPLIRFALLTVREERAWLVLSFHHIILDGWSLLILWNEAAAFYAAELAGTSAQLPPAADEGAVAEWLHRRSDADSERFWRSRLAGFAEPTPIASAASPAADEPAEIEHVMAAAAGAAITAAAHACRVSPAIVFEVLWALLLAGRTRRTDVAFAATVSGRPSGIPGIERLVGCFINTVPIRARLDDAGTLRECLARHQEQRAEQAEYEYCSAGQIHQWSELRPGEPICRSLLVYENLRGAGAEAAAEPSVSEAGRRVRGARTGYPVTLLISPGPAPHLRVVYQPGSISTPAARDLMEGLERLALRLPDHLDDGIREWRESVAFVPPSELTAAPSARPPFVAPRTRLEHELATIWEGLFKVAPIGVLDDFFSLGGHSLLVLQMAARLRSAIGAELPLHVLVSETTIEKLARACAVEVNEHAALIPLSAEGDGLPIYCPHPLGGHVLCYGALGRRLVGRHRAWGLQAKGLAGGESPAASWEELIAHHWALLTEARASASSTRHPLDGVALLGYSYGGYIAMELAARARREGATRVPVLLLDVPHPSVIPIEHRLPDAATLLHALCGHALGLDLDQMRRLPADGLTRHVYDAAVTQHLIPRDTPFEQVERVLNVARAHSQLQPPVTAYDFPVVLFRAREGAERISSLPDLGWAGYSAGVTIEWVAGSHETMLDPPYAGNLADLVAKHLT
ncbi:MAG: condensation domain-containing protein [Vicinamibacterales bacterium]|jgi:thioesterase domain-containing protein